MLCLSERFLSEIFEKASESFLFEVVFQKVFRSKVFHFNVSIHETGCVPFMKLSCNVSCNLLFNHFTLQIILYCKRMLSSGVELLRRGEREGRKNPERKGMDRTNGWKDGKTCK